MIKKLESAWNWLVYDKSDLAMVLRTVFEAIMGYLMANMVEIMDLFPCTAKTNMVIMGIVSVILSAIMGSYRKQREKAGNEGA